MSDSDNFEKNMKEYGKNIEERSKKGIVLVLDLDQTLVGEYSDQRNLNSEEILLNPRAVELLRKAIDAREKGIVSAIFLLTNNADEFFIKIVELTLSMKLKKKYYFAVFDYIMSRNHPFRSAPFDNPPKSLREVEYMMIKEKIPTENLATRVFFIDDNSEHAIRAQIPEDHYIVVTPPFVRGVIGHDETDYSVLETVLQGAVRGGGRGGTRKRSIFRIQRKRRIKTRKH
jgi:hypothetical protein